MISLVIPIYNEADHIEDAIEQILTVLERMNKEYEIILAEDGSTDGSSEIADRLAAVNPRIRHSYSQTRLGRGKALRVAFMEAKGDIVLFMDADLSTNLRHVSELIEKIDEGYDIAVGSKMIHGAKVDRPLIRAVVSKTYNWFVRRLFDVTLTDMQIGFKAFRRSRLMPLLDEVEANHWFWDTEVMLRAARKGYRIAEIPVEWTQGPDSKFNLIQDITSVAISLLRLRLTFLFEKPRCTSSASYDFNAGATEYDTILGESHKYYVQLKVGLLQEELKHRMGSVLSLSLLDVGCGTGLAENLLGMRERYLIGLDLAGDMLQIAKARCAYASYVCADSVGGIPFPDNTFDVVFCFALMHHLAQDQRQRAIREIARVTKPNGYVFTFEHNPANPFVRHIVRGCAVDEGIELIRPAEMVRLHRDVGLHVVSVKYLVFFPRMLSLLRSLESLLYWIPFGGQYEVVGRK